MEVKILAKLILVAISFEATFGKSLEKSQNSKSKTKRMVNGVPATISDWPFIASLSYGADANVLWKVCSATLINRRWLVTVAHCVMNKDNTKIQPGHLKVNIRRRENSWSTDEFNVVEIHAHPPLSEEYATPFDNDIALIKLEREVPSHIQTIGMYAGNGQLSNCKSAGWGATQELVNGAQDVLSMNYEISASLQQIDVPIGVSWKECIKGMEPPHIYSENHDHKAFCAGDKTSNPANAESGCIGDSGSPLVCDSSSGLVLYGLLIGGHHKCTPGASYMIFSDVAKHRQWVHSVFTA